MWVSQWCCWPGYLYRAILLSKGECILGLKILCICQDIMTLQKPEYISILYWGHKKKSHGWWKWCCFRLPILSLALYFPPAFSDLTQWTQAPVISDNWHVAFTANFHMKRITNDWSGIYIYIYVEVCSTRSVTTLRHERWGECSIPGTSFMALVLFY
jgi:hypothetical protein